MTYTEAANVLREVLNEHEDEVIHEKPCDECSALSLAVEVLLHGTAKEQQCESCGRPLELTAIACPCGSHDLRPVHEKVKP